MSLFAAIQSAVLGWHLIIFSMIKKHGTQENNFCEFLKWNHKIYHILMIDHRHDKAEAVGRISFDKYWKLIDRMSDFIAEMYSWSVADKCIIWNDPRSTGTEATASKEISPEVRTWALNACHRCLVYLGDIGMCALREGGCSAAVTALW